MPLGATTQPCSQVDLVQLVETTDGTPRAPLLGWQYVNLDPAPGHREYGRAIKLKARVQWVAGDASRPLTGQNVYWYVVRGRRNRRGLTGQMTGGFDSQSSRRWTKRTPVDAEGWTPEVTFYLSRYGGDVFWIFATCNPAYRGGRGAGPYTIWRRLYYEVDCMRRAGGTGTYRDRAYLRGMAYEFGDTRGFVELWRVGPIGEVPHRRIVKESEANAWAANYRNQEGTYRPRYFHLLFIDTIAWDPVNQTRTFTLRPGRNQITLNAANDTLDSGDWYVSARYTEQGTGRTGNLPQGRFTLTEAGAPATRNDRYVLTVDFSGLGLNRANRPVTVRLTFKTWTEGSGLQSGLSTIIGMRWRERAYGGTTLRTRTINTMVHEPGHLMGLAATTLPDHSPCTTTYVQAGHHCNNLSNGCVMWESNSTSTAFCPNCRDALRGRNLSSVPIDGADPFT